MSLQSLGLLSVSSGPNTGGKTATLKTLGLCVIMAKSGLYIPVENPSEEVYLKWFDKVLIDIGDSQSLQQSLSTFTGHVRRLNKVHKFTSYNLHFNTLSHLLIFFLFNFNDFLDFG